MGAVLDGWSKCYQVLPDLAFRTRPDGQKERTVHYNFTVVWDKYGDPLLIPGGRDPVYYIRKGYLIDKPVNPEPKPVVEKVKVENPQVKLMDEMADMRAELKRLREEREQDLKEENKRLKNK